MVSSLFLHWCGSTEIPQKRTMNSISGCYVTIVFLVRGEEEVCSFGCGCVCVCVCVSFPHQARPTAWTTQPAHERSVSQRASYETVGSVCCSFLPASATARTAIQKKPQTAVLVVSKPKRPRGFLSCFLPTYSSKASYHAAGV